MLHAAPPIWIALGIAIDCLSAVVLASVAVWLTPRRERFGSAGGAMVSALILTALCRLFAAVGSSPSTQFGASIAEGVRNLAWLLVLSRLFGRGGTAKAPGIAPLVMALAFVEGGHMLIDLGLSQIAPSAEALSLAFRSGIMLRLLLAIGGLVLVHNLYAAQTEEGRRAYRWPLLGIALLWTSDLNIYTIAYAGGVWPQELAALRGLVAAALALTILIGASKDREQRQLSPSRAATFHTFSLLLVGGYIGVLGLISRWLTFVDDSLVRLMVLAAMTLATALALVVLPSHRIRGHFKVVIAKHLFKHRYDYREEWLRLARTMGGDHHLPLQDRVVRSVTQIFASPGGLLLTPGDDGALVLSSRYHWPDIDAPAVAYPAEAMAQYIQGFVAEVDHERTRPDSDLPKWILRDDRAWALVPLIHYDRLLGMVVLARPTISRAFDWEDFDLLRVIGQQLGSYLAENASQQAIAENARFDEFNRRIAFVMHDIKNLASQFSLLARNAELHAEKPAFRADMLLTLRSSSDKLNILLDRLSRYGGTGADRLEAVSASHILSSIANRFSGRIELSPIGRGDVLAGRHALEQVLVHLIQNGLDATISGAPVSLGFHCDGDVGHFEIADKGAGMSAEFIRTHLFQPFVSTKPNGFGIGAFEARELIHAMNGQLDVESREGVGTRFRIRLPLALASSTALPLEKVA